MRRPCLLSYSLSFLLYLVIFILLSPLAKGECPNACSGNGRCTNYAAQFESSPNPDNQLPTAAGTVTAYGYDTAVPKKDSCTCFTKLGYNGAEVYAWTGADCSLKTCPYGPAYAGAPYADNSHAQALECSGAGKCDRKSGICACFPGYTGHNCGRTTCPNDCNGNGVCKSLKQIAADVVAAAAYLDFSTSAISYGSAFDAEQSRGCVCDSGYIGPDCSILQCPSSSDPVGGKGSEYGRPCSGRGACGANGKCQCYRGFFGTQCELQRANVI